MADVVNRIVKFNDGRDAQLLEIKYQKMREDAFAFFRGTCHLFYENWPTNSPLNDAPPIWICGDLHLQNFGFYEGDDGLIYFDVNDFDESLLAPVVWDVARLLTSIQLFFPSTPSSQLKQWSQQFLGAYSGAVAQGQMRSIHTAIAPPMLRHLMQKRERRSHTSLLSEYTEYRKKSRQFKFKAGKTLPISDITRKQAIAILKSWSADQPDANSYHVIDVGTRLSGLGSMGVERYLMLVEGSKSTQLLELKQRLNPSSKLYSDPNQPRWPNAAERVVTLQSRLQAVPPTPLIAISHHGLAYTLRELYPADTKVDLTDFKEPDSWKALIELLGKITAYAHLRGCGRQGASGIDDLINYAAGLAWRSTILEISQDYSQQVRADYAAFCRSDLGKG